MIPFRQTSKKKDVFWANDNFGHTGLTQFRVKKFGPKTGSTCWLSRTLKQLISARKLVAPVSSLASDFAAQLHPAKLTFQIRYTLAAKFTSPGVVLKLPRTPKFVTPEPGRLQKVQLICKTRFRDVNTNSSLLHTAQDLCVQNCSPSSHRTSMLFRSGAGATSGW